MNEVSYGQPRPADLDQMLASSPGGSSPAMQELSQLILLGMQRDIETQIDWRLQQRGASGRKAVSGEEVGLILGSIALAIPLTVLAGIYAALPGIVIVWLGLVLINVAWTQRH